MMNKKLILAIALLLLGNALIAQNHEDQWVWPDDMKTDELLIHLDVGPVIGGGMTFATDPLAIQTDFGNGFCYQLGIAANGRLVYQKSPQPHGLSRIGFGVEALLRNTSVKTEDEPLNMLSLDIPIMVHFYVTSGFMLEAGASLVKSLHPDPDRMLFGPTFVHSDEIECNDVMLSVGADYKTPFGLAFNLRYNHGNSYASVPLDGKISTLVFCVSYRFSIIK